MRVAAGVTAVLLPVVALAVTGCTKESTDRAKAEIACENLVKQRLQNPDEAQFEHTSYTVTDGRTDVRGSVQADGRSRTFGCTIKDDVIKLDVLE